MASRPPERLQRVLLADLCLPRQPLSIVAESTAANLTGLGWLWETKTFSNGGGRMVKMLRAVAVLGCVGSLAGSAIAQDNHGGFGSNVPSTVKRLEAQCAHRRRTMPPDENDECARNARDSQSTYGQGGNQAAQNAGQVGPGGAGPGGAGPGGGGPGGKGG